MAAAAAEPTRPAAGDEASGATRHRGLAENLVAGAHEAGETAHLVDYDGRVQPDGLQALDLPELPALSILDRAVKPLDLARRRQSVAEGRGVTHVHLAPDRSSDFRLDDENEPPSELHLQPRTGWDSQPSATRARDEGEGVL
eukprot:9497798-Pyramimonas_sp.AAC.1